MSIWNRRPRRDIVPYMTQDSPITPEASPTVTATSTPTATTTAATPATPTPTPTTAGVITIDQFAAVKFRVAKVLSAVKLEKSKKLLKLQIDLGPELGQKQILSGIALHYTPESIVGRKIVVVANLAPAKMMGEESQGMLLAASTPDGTKLTLVDPGQDMPEGSEVR